MDRNKEYIREKNRWKLNVKLDVVDLWLKTRALAEKITLDVM